MALILDLSYTERNDNKVLTVSDATTNWGTGGNIATTAITTLTLDITITESNGVTTVYDQIDLLASFGVPNFPTQADMVFPIDNTYLIKDSVEYGTALETIPDGIWTLTYIVDESLGSEVSFTEDILVKGVVRANVYEKLRTLPTTYNCNECKSKEILDAVFCNALLTTMESDGYVAKNEELINTLYTIQRLIDNGSSYTW